MEKEGFVLYKGFYEPLKHLSDEQLGKLFRAIFEFQINGCEEVDDDLKIAFLFLKNQFDLDKIKWENKKVKRSEAGKKGMAKRWEKNNNDNNVINDITNDNNVINDITNITNDNKNNKTYQNITNITDKVKVKVKVKDKVKEKEKEKVNINTANEKNFFEDSQLNEKMKEFIIHRKELKDPMTDRGITLLTNKINSYLTEYTKEQVLDFFDEAIINSRKSVFPTKNYNNKNRATGQNEKSKSNTYTVENFTDRLNFTDINNEELTLKEIATNFNYPIYNEKYLKTMIRIIKHIGIDKAKEEYKEVSKTTFSGIAPLDWLEDHLYTKYINEVNNNN